MASTNINISVIIVVMDFSEDILKNPKQKIKDRIEELSSKSMFFKWFFKISGILLSYSLCFVLVYLTIQLWVNFSDNNQEYLLNTFGGKDTDAEDAIIVFTIVFFIQPLLYTIIFSKTKQSIHPVTLSLLTIVGYGLVYNRFDIGLFYFVPFAIIIPLLVQWLYFTLIKRFNSNVLL